MKEVFAPIGTELLRPLATLMLPGAVALTPYLVLLHRVFPRFDQLASANTAEGISAFVVASLFVGFILEDAGSDMESSWDDADPKISEMWKAYWRLAFRVEPMGHRYLRSLLLRMKFELGTIVALRVALPGIVVLFFLNSGQFKWFPGLSMFLVFVVVFVLTALLHSRLLRWAKEGHRLLHDVRVELLKGITVIGESSPASPQGAQTP